MIWKIRFLAKNSCLRTLPKMGVTFPSPICSRGTLSPLLYNISRSLKFLGPLFFVWQKRLCVQSYGLSNLEFWPNFFVKNRQNGPKTHNFDHPTLKWLDMLILTAKSDSPSKISPKHAFWEKNKFLLGSNFLPEQVGYWSLVQRRLILVENWSKIEFFKSAQMCIFRVFMHVWACLRDVCVHWGCEGTSWVSFAVGQRTGFAGNLWPTFGRQVRGRLRSA